MMDFKLYLPNVEDTRLFTEEDNVPGHLEMTLDEIISVDECLSHLKKNAMSFNSVIEAL